MQIGFQMEEPSDGDPDSEGVSGVDAGVTPGLVDTWGSLIFFEAERDYAVSGARGADPREPAAHDHDSRRLRSGHGVMLAERLVAHRVDVTD
jgi:hypothetical protein